MPTYNYICHNCSNLSEATHGMDEKLEECPHCESKEHLRKMPSGVTIVKHKEQLRDDFKKAGHVPGEIVKESIEEIKGDVDADREALKKRVWLPPGQK